MKINGTEYGFMLTAGAAVEIAALCPGGDLERFDEALTGKNTKETVEKQYRFAKILNDGYVEFSRLMGRDAAQLDEKTMYNMPFGVYVKIKQEAFDAFSRGLQGEIDAEPIDGKKQETEAQG